MGVNLIIYPSLKLILVSLAFIAGIFVIGTKNAIISVFNLIVLYILVAFYLIYMGITYLGISYIIVYIGAIAILFLFVIMMIDVEIIEKKSNNYLPLLFLLLGGFIISLKKILYNIGVIKIKSLSYEKQDNFLIDCANERLFNRIFQSDIHEDKVILKGIGIENNFEEFSHEENSKKDDSSVFDSVDSKEDYFSVLDKDNHGFNLDVNELLENVNLMIEDNSLKIEKLPMPDLNDLIGISTYNENNYLLILPDWDSAINRITQVSAIGDVLYSVYHSYIYIVSVILLLGMIGAIILTAESNIHRRVMNLRKPRMKSSNMFSGFFIFADILNVMRFNYYYYKEEYKNKYKLYKGVKKSVKLNIEYPIHITFSGYIPLFILNNNNIHSEDILGNLIYFIVSNVIVGLLLLIINSFFSLSVKYLEKGGGFECGFTSFLQTRERYNIIFYRVSLLFLVFDLEIILIFPYPALYQKNQNISKNNVLAFLYILIVGFIYELKEGALNIVKKAHSTEINIKD